MSPTGKVSDDPDGMRPPAELQAPAHKKIWRELIALTPEHWHWAALSVVRQNPDWSPSEEALTFTISSRERYDEPIMPSVELVEYIREVDTLFREHDAKWQAAEYVVKQSEDGDWKGEVSFTYKTESGNRDAVGAP
jgi:hypothetical protein